MFSLTRLIRHQTANPKTTDVNDHLVKSVKNDLKSVDLKISLYIAACEGLPMPEIRPSPPVISSESNRIVDASSLDVNDKIPPPEGLLTYLTLPEGILSCKTYNVLQWLITGLRQPKITCVPIEDHKTLISLVGPGLDVNNVTNQPAPEEIFSLKPHFMSTMGQQWRIKSSYMTTNYGFLPCKVEELHCLIYKGLVSSAAETDGSLVLHTDLNYCVNLSPSAWTWGKSNLGVNLKIVAIVEYVDDPMYVTKEEREIGHANLGCITLKNIKLLDASFSRIRYLLIYPQGKRNPTTLPIRKISDGQKFIKFSILFAWAVTLSIACLVPRAKFMERSNFL